MISINSPSSIEKTIFVFQEPIERTDLPRAELVSLIELTVPNLTYEVIDTNEWFKEERQEIAKIFPTETGLKEKAVVHKIAGILFLDQTAIVYSNFALDLEEIVRRAGYVQSAGKLVYAVKWADLSVKKILEDLLNFCKEQKEAYNLYFYEKDQNKIGSEKLDRLLIDGKRWHIGDESFRTASKKIQEDLSADLMTNGITKIGEGNIFVYRDSMRAAPNGVLADFYQDRDVTEYAICYLSLVKKDNPIHTLDTLNEAKPFWGGIFTTPHRLMNAMLNLAKVGEGSVVVDPFCHTGTMAIEAAQIGCIPILADLAEPMGAKDNYEFLCSGADNLISLSKKMYQTACENIDIQSDIDDLASPSANLNKHGQPEVHDDFKIEKIIAKYAGKNSDLQNIENRLYFYIARRYHMMLKRQFDPEATSSSERVRKNIGHPDDPLFNDSLERKAGQPIPGYYLSGLQLKAFEDANKVCGRPIISPKTADYTNLFPDHQYSSKRIGFISKARKAPTFLMKDINGPITDYGIENGSVDAVISDPPYGYGEDLNEEQVRQIYESFFEKAFDWLRPGGYLVFCTLDKVKTGRTDDLLFTEDILRICNQVAHRQGIDFVVRNFFPVNSGGFFVSFWKSKYALNRAVVCIQILKDFSKNIKL